MARIDSHHQGQLHSHASRGYRPVHGIAPDVAPRIVPPASSRMRKEVAKQKRKAMLAERARAARTGARRFITGEK